jgi:WD40 repeat protein
MIPDSAGGAAAMNKADVASFVSAGRDSTMNIWTANGDCISTHTAHKSTVNFLSEIHFNFLYKPSLQGCPTIISLGGDNNMKIWDLKRFRLVSNIPMSPASGNATKAVWVNQAIVTSSSNGSVKMWTYLPTSSNNANNDASSIAEGTVGEGTSSDCWVSSDLAGHQHPCTDLISADQFLASASKSGQIHVYNFL